MEGYKEILEPVYVHGLVIIFYYLHNFTLFLIPTINQFLLCISVSTGSRGLWFEDLEFRVGTSVYNLHEVYSINRINRIQTTFSRKQTIRWNFILPQFPFIVYWKQYGHCNSINMPVIEIHSPVTVNECSRHRWEICIKFKDWRKEALSRWLHWTNWFTLIYGHEHWDKTIQTARHEARD